MKNIQQIKELDNKVIPEVDFVRILRNGGAIPSDVANAVQKRGILIIRGVLGHAEASNYLNELTDYMKQNGEDPEAVGNTLFEVYWSKAQVRLPIF